MPSRWMVALATAFSILFLAVGSGQAVICNPLCAPDVRGTDYSKTVANQNGVNNGIANAQQQPGNYKSPTVPPPPCTGC